MPPRPLTHLLEPKLVYGSHRGGDEFWIYVRAGANILAELNVLLEDLDRGRAVRSIRLWFFRFGLIVTICLVVLTGLRRWSRGYFGARGLRCAAVLACAAHP